MELRQALVGSNRCSGGRSRPADFHLPGRQRQSRRPRGDFDPGSRTPFDGRTEIDANPSELASIEHQYNVADRYVSVRYGGDALDVLLVSTIGLFIATGLSVRHAKQLEKEYAFASN